jgi:hypothetical protein
MMPRYWLRASRSADVVPASFAIQHPPSGYQR